MTSLDRAIALIITLTFVALSSVARAQNISSKQTPPQGSDGHADLEEAWNFPSATPPQRPVELTNKAFFTKRKLRNWLPKPAVRGRGTHPHRTAALILTTSGWTVDCRSTTY